MIKTKASDNYRTPDWILNIFDNWFDPCPLNENPTIDGLLLDWKDKTYVNPPYSRPMDWVKKAIAENKKGKTIAMLLKVDTSTKWFAKLVEANAKIMFIHGRLKHHTGKPANFPSMLVVLCPKCEEKK